MHVLYNINLLPILNHSTHKYLFLSEINIMHQYSQLKSKYTGKIVDKACESESR